MSLENIKKLHINEHADYLFKKLKNEPEHDAHNYATIEKFLDNLEEIHNQRIAKSLGEVRDLKEENKFLRNIISFIIKG